jgi:hypothetical protein
MTLPSTAPKKISSETSEAAALPAHRACLQPNADQDINAIPFALILGTHYQSFMLQKAYRKAHRPISE